MGKINEEEISNAIQWASGETVDQEQSALYMQDLMRQALAINAMMFALSIGFLIIAGSCLCTLDTKRLMRTDALITSIMVFSIVASLLFLVYSVPRIIKLKNSPRVFIVEHIRNI